jgi:hypothetical protein
VVSFRVVEFFLFLILLLGFGAVFISWAIVDWVREWRDTRRTEHDHRPGFSVIIPEDSKE